MSQFFPNRSNQKTEKRRPLFSRNHNTRPSKIRSFFKYIINSAIIGILGTGIAGVAFISWVSRDLPNPNKIIDREVPLTTKIYDRTGQTVLYEIHGAEKRTAISLADIPQYAIQATITAEDRGFYEHRGFSVAGIIRSIIKNIASQERVGGSTITQQLVKNAILSSEKTYTRKAKELILSYQIEKKFSKDDILKMYFNEIPYGSVVYGIEAASQTFFGKSAKDITLAEAAILAAIPQAPTYYSPTGNHTDKLSDRQKWVLDSMAKLGYVTAEEARAAKEEKITYRKSLENIVAPHFVMFVKEYLTEKYGEKTVGEGGLKIITTLDRDKQKFAEDAINNRVEKNKQYNASNAALLSLDPKTGQILAMVGSADYFNEEIDGQVNVTTRARQPGSSFKPIVYAAAFKKGYTPETVLFDVETKFINFDGKEYAPKNYDLKEHGTVTLRQALAGSLNIPAVKVIYLTGINNVLDLADELGYATLKDRWRFGLSLVLGGGEVKLLEHANAFAVFAREGEFHPTTGVLRVENKDGEILEEYKEKKSKVLETEIARQITSILSDNSARSFIFGENNSLTLKDRAVAVKTGTTNDYRDAWTLGYTPSLVAGVWVGNNDFSAMKKGADGSVVAAPIWNAYMAAALANTPVENFIQPELNTLDNPVLNGSMKDGLKVKVDTISGKLATEYTPADFIEERTYRVLHSILYYINKDDPRGTPPQNPNTDPQFEIWESAIQDWGKRNNIISEEPPTEYDDVHTPQNQPTVAIFSPQNNAVIASRNIFIDTQAYSPRGIQRIEYYLGGKLIGEKYFEPYSLSILLDNNDIPNGSTTLRVSAYDQVGNVKQAFVDVVLNLPKISPGAIFEYPKDGKILNKNSFPLDIAFDISRPQNIDTINAYAEFPGKTKQLIGSSRQVTETRVMVPWSQYPGPGIYGLYFSVVNKDGYMYQGEKILIEIQ